MRKVLSTTSLSLLESARLALASEGIAIVVSNDLSAGLGIPTSIFVGDDDYERAAEIVSDLT